LCLGLQTFAEGSQSRHVRQQKIIKGKELTEETEILET
jgi:hypothetical protein